MATAERRAEVVWEGDLPRGNGRFTVGIGAMGEQPVTWTSRTERDNGKTSPEELIAAAHGSCFAMALSGALAEGGTPPERCRAEGVRHNRSSKRRRRCPELGAMARGSAYPYGPGRRRRIRRMPTLHR